MPPRSLPQYKTSHLPKQVNVEGRDFGRTLKQWQEFHSDVFQSTNAPRGFWDIDTFQGSYRAAPERQRAFSRNLIARLFDYERNGNKANGYTLWDHQIALARQIAVGAVQKRSLQTVESILMVETPGGGKNMINGLALQSISDAMVRGETQENALVLFKRKSLISQQVMSTNERFQNVLSWSSTNVHSSALRQQHSFIAQVLRPLAANCISIDEWKALREREYKNQKDALRAVMQFFKSKDLWSRAQQLPNLQELLHWISSFLTHRGAVIQAPLTKRSADEYQFLDIGPPPSESARAGDLLFGIDEQLKEREAVFVQTKFEIEGCTPDELPNRNTRIAIFSQGALSQDRSRKNANIHNVGYTIADEAISRAAHEFQALSSYGQNGHRPSFVLAATAHDPGMQYDLRLDELTPHLAVNSARPVLKPLRIRQFPLAGESIYPSGTFEAADQLLGAYTEHYGLLQHAKEVQPIEGNHLVVCDAAMIPYVTMMLREYHASTGIQVVSFDDNAGHEVHSAAIQAAFNNDNADVPPIAIVASGGTVLDSYDWPQMKTIFLGALLNNEAAMLRLCGRLLHTKADGGGLIVHQKFAAKTGFSVTPHKAIGTEIPELQFRRGTKGINPDDVKVKMVPGQYFFGAEAVQKEKPVMKKLEKTGKVHFEDQYGHLSWQPYTSIHPVEQGTFPPKLNDQRDSKDTSHIFFPVMGNRKTILGDSYVAEFSTMNRVSAESVHAELKTLKGVDPVEALKISVLRIRRQNIPHLPAKPWAHNLLGVEGERLQSSSRQGKRRQTEMDRLMQDLANETGEDGITLDEDSFPEEDAEDPDDIDNEDFDEDEDGDDDEDEDDESEEPRGRRRNGGQNGRNGYSYDHHEDTDAGIIRREMDRFDY